MAIVFAVVLLIAGQSSSEVMAGPGRAEPTPSPRVAITSMTFAVSQKTKLLRKAIHRELARGLAGAGLLVIPPAQLARKLAGHPRLVGCEMPSCLEKVGELLRAPFCAQVRIFGGPSKLRIAVVITWSQSGKVAVRAEGRCLACTSPRVEQEVGRLSVAAGGKALEAYRSLPRRRANGKGYHTANGRGKPGNIKRRGPVWITGMALLGAGVATAVGGVTLLALDGRTYKRKPDRYVDVFKTRTGGIVFTTIGSLAAITGVALLVYHVLSKGKQRVPVSLGFDPRRGAVVLGGSF